MFIDVANFPIVRLVYDQGPSQTEDEGLAAFEALLDRETPFVIIGQGAPADEAQHEHDPAERKKLALFSKKHKPRLRAFVKAMIYIEPSTAKRLAMKAFQVVFEKFWGYPMLVAASEAEALAKAKALLRPASDNAPTARIVVRDQGIP